MNIDEKIKNELQSEAQETDLAFEQPQGLFGLVASAYRGGLGRWMILVTAITLGVSALLIWSGYEFFTAAAMQDQLYWGICFIASLVTQIALKQWTWMEMNRNSLLREIKRLELAIERQNA